MKNVVSLLFSFITAAGAFAQGPAAVIATVGKPLPAWKEGYLDLHHINTGRGNAAFYIFPDGTTMLFDAGEIDPTDARTTSRRNTPERPDSSRHPYEWIVDYIRRVAPRFPSGQMPGAAGDKAPVAIDYAIISHFHDDHFGSWYPSAPLSADGKYALTGITGVGDKLPIHTLLTRDWHYPVDPGIQLRQRPASDHYVRTWNNYLAFVDAQRAKGRTVEFLKAGTRRQIGLVHEPAGVPSFYVQNIKSNGWIWTGKDSTVKQHFPPVDTADRRTWPDENPLSNAILIHYGLFNYYTGGDNPGNVFLGDAPWRDVETDIANAVGEVDVATMDHHGNRDALNEHFISTLKPRVWIEQVWTADHPGHEVLIRATSKLLYPGARDLFATNFMEANELVIGPLVAQSYKSRQGHIVVRVLPGGSEYYVIVLEDGDNLSTVKQVNGPYEAKGK